MGQKPSLPFAGKRKAKPHPGAHRLLHHQSGPPPRRAGDILPSLRGRGVGGGAKPLRGLRPGGDPEGRAGRDARIAARRHMPVLCQAVQGRGAGGPRAGFALRAQHPRLRDLSARGAGHPAGASARRAPRPFRPTPVDRIRCMCRLLPCPRGLPRYSGGSASTPSLSRPAQASLALRPAGSLDRPRRPSSQGFDPVDYPTEPPASYQINRQLSGRNLPPLVTCAVGAH